MSVSERQAAGDTRFEISRTFSAPRERVWDAWTDTAQLAAWFGPKGCRTTVHACNVAPEGITHMSMAMEGGATLWARFRYVEVQRPERLVWEHSFSDPGGGIARSPFDRHWPLTLRTEVRFEPVDGGTRVTLTWVPVDAAPEEHAAFTAIMDSMNEGWSGTFDKLEEQLARG